MTEEGLQNLSRALTHMIFRNGIVEKFHAKEAPLTQDVMKAINKDVNNRIYAILKLRFNSIQKEDRELYAAWLALALDYGSSWDKAEMPEEIEELRAMLNGKPDGEL